MSRMDSAAHPPVEPTQDASMTEPVCAYFDGLRYPITRRSGWVMAPHSVVPGLAQGPVGSRSTTRGRCRQLAWSTTVTQRL